MIVDDLPIHMEKSDMNERRSAVPKILSLVIVLALGVGVLAAEEGKSYGEPLTGTDTVKISQLLSDPDDYLDKVVRVEGLVTGVCEKRGCWLSIASEDEEFKEIRVKVDDGVIVFPLEAKGKHAIAEVVFVKIEMSMEQTLKYREHQAKEHGEDFDPGTVTEPLVFYQIKGSGAVIR
jgi:hypothetical protein